MSLVVQARDVRSPTRWLGHFVAAAVNAILLYLLNVSPGWDAVPVLTDATPQVLGLVNLALFAAAAAHLLYLAYDRPWFVALGDLVTTGIGFVVLVRVWRVFPFAFTGTVDWALVTRTVLVLGMVGAGIALVVNLARLLLRLGDEAAGRS